MNIWVFVWVLWFFSLTNFCFILFYYSSSMGKRSAFNDHGSMAYLFILIWMTTFHLPVVCFSLLFVVGVGASFCSNLHLRSYYYYTMIRCIRDFVVITSIIEVKKKPSSHLKDKKQTSITYTHAQKNKNSKRFN